MEPFHIPTTFLHLRQFLVVIQEVFPDQWHFPESEVGASVGDDAFDNNCMVILGLNGQRKVRNDIVNQSGEPRSVTLDNAHTEQSLEMILRKALIWSSLEMHVAIQAIIHSSITRTCW